jgi:membrane peptidoglycan carboxypeptidase
MEEEGMYSEEEWLKHLYETEQYSEYLRVAKVRDKRRSKQRREEIYNSIKTTTKNVAKSIIKSTVTKYIVRLLTLTSTAELIDYHTNIVEKAVGITCRILPHKEQGRFWEGVHLYEQHTSALKKEETLLNKVQEFFPGISSSLESSLESSLDMGLLPDVTVIEHYPISTDNAIKLRTADGEVFYEKPATQIYLNKLPENVERAIIQREDRDFYNHAGINHKGLARAILNRGKKGGGSSIDMQVAKQLALGRGEIPEYSKKRKVTDMLGAVELNSRYEKEDILLFYANYMYFGNGNYGIEAAAQDYFGKPATDLAFNEAVFLACLLNDPGNNPKTKKGFDVQWNDYKREITKLMNDGEITEEEAQSYYWKHSIKIKKRSTKRIKELPGYGSAAQTIYYHGLRDVYDLNLRPAIDPGERFYSIDITTTIGPLTTKAAYTAMQESKIPKHTEASIIVLDDKQRIKAVIGTKEPHKIADATTKHNTAIERKRPMGSTFKPLYFTYAEEQGIIDLEDRFTEKTRYRNKEGHLTPRNWDNRYDRVFTPHGALVNSNNRVSVQIYDKVRKSRFGGNWKDFREYLTVIGLDTGNQFQDRKDYTYALGTQSATGLELASAYNAVFNEASDCEPWIISRLQIGNNTVEYDCNAEPLLEKTSAFHSTLEIIAKKNKVTNRHGTVGLKTGTTNEAYVTRIAGFYDRAGVDYAFVIDVDGQGQSVGGAASQVVAPIARSFFANLE